MSTSVSTPQAESNLSAAAGAGLSSVKDMWQKVTANGERQLLILSVLAITVASVIVLLLWTGSAAYRPLYGSQEKIDAAQIIEVMNAQGFDYKIDINSGQVLVPEESLGEIRMLLAANGVKAQMPVGFENLAEQAIGTSQFMEQAQYRHSLEGELARTIMSMDAVAHARVHLAIPKRTLFMRADQEKASASVLLQLNGGHKLDAGQITAIANVVSGSVSGLNADKVQIIDQDGNLLSAMTAGDRDFTESQSKQANYVRSLEQGLIDRANKMLDPILGAGNYQVQVAAKVNFDQVEETQETVDPQTAITQETLRSDQSSSGVGAGVPGAIANQPVTNMNGDKNENVSNQETRQYTVGRSVRHIKYQQMRLDNISVSLLLNDGVASEEGWQPEHLEQISSMVKTAIGFDAERGDTFAVNNFNFLAVEEVAFETLPWWQSQDLHSYLRYLVAAILGLALILFVLRPLVKHLVKSSSPADTDDNADDNLMLGSEGVGTDPDDILAAFGLADAGNSLGSMSGGSNLSMIDSPLSEKIEHLSTLANQDPARVAEVIGHWMREKKQ